jgi:hypothetical protein
MNRQMRLLGGLGAAGLVVVTVMATSAAGSSSGQKFTITDTRNGATFAFVDNEPKTTMTDDQPARVSPGDEFLLVNKLTTQTGGKGKGTFHCVALRAVPGSTENMQVLCTFDLALPNGHLTGSGRVNLFGDKIVLPITGGTGEYAGANGTVTRIEGPDSMNGGTDTIRLT